MFQLVCDPSGVVVETTIKELVPALINWGNKLDHILRVLFSYILSSAQVSAFLCTIFTPVNQKCHVKYFADHIIFSELSTFVGGGRFCGVTSTCFRRERTLEH